MSTTASTLQKFTDDEMTEVKYLRQKHDEKIVLLGQLKLEQMRLEDNFQQLNNSKIKLQEVEDNLKKELVDLQQVESAFLTKITAKYGQGSLNPITGEFTPVSFMVPPAQA